MAAQRAGLWHGRASRCAVDGSGFEAHHVSHYFVRRRSRGDKRVQSMTYRRFPKVGLLADCRTHLILAAVPGRGPGPDHLHIEETLCQAHGRAAIETLYADAGYDAEWVHEHVRLEHGIPIIIPPLIGRPTEKPPSTYYRRSMRTYFRRPAHLRGYGQRWQIETVNSMLKRRLSETLNARTHHRQNRALLLKVITHNLMIVPHKTGFSTEQYIINFILPVWLPLVLLCVPTVFFWRSARRSRTRPGHCARCSYDLTGNVSGKCSECGAMVKPVAAAV